MGRLERTVLVRALLAFGLTQTLNADAAEPSRNEVFVPGGSFVRGRLGGRADEAPPHTVRLKPFYIDATLVTRAAFEAFTRETGYRTTAERIGYGLVSMEGMLDWEWERVVGVTFRRPFRNEDGHTADFLRPDAPVVMVTYDDATAYCAHQGKRLPTEAEWEYAMRGGASTTRFSWGDEPRRPDGKYGLNYWQGESHAKNLATDGFVYVSPVRAFPPNALGVFDTAGNVWQWTRDWYGAGTYAAFGSADAVDPRGPATGEKRVLRGGSWWCGDCACAGYGLFYRGKAKPGAPFNNNGFRCARDA